MLGNSQQKLSNSIEFIFENFLIVSIANIKNGQVFLFLLRIIVVYHGSYLYLQYNNHVYANPHDQSIAFTDVVGEYELDYRHETGSFLLENNTHSKYMPESMGSGIVIFDFDNDGDNDIFINNSSSYNYNQLRVGNPKLYENKGHFNFIDISVEAGFNFSRHGMGAIAADYNGDGLKDLLLTGLGGPWLYQNLGNRKFRNVSKQVGIDPITWQDNRGNTGKTWSTGGVFLDVDNDQDLDLFVINYVKWSPQADIYTTFDTVRKGYTSPRSYEGTHPQLYIQEQGKFIDKTLESGLSAVEGKSLGVAVWDFNDDGLLDIVVANDTIQNFYFQNTGNTKFSDSALASGIAYDENGNSRAGMGIDIADFMNNGSSAVAIGNFQNEPTSFFVYNAKGRFSENSQSVNVFHPTYSVLTFGLLFADFDLDGWQDLLMANGHIEPLINQIDSNANYRQPMTFLRNNGHGKFEDWSDFSGFALKTKMAGRGLATGDLDNDGDLDIVVTENGGPLRLLRNDIGQKNYIRVKLIGKPPNTDAIGAIIKLPIGEIVQKRIVRTGGSYLSQSELIQTFGLGESPDVEKLYIKWPDGDIEYINLDRINKTYTIYQTH